MSKTTDSPLNGRVAIITGAARGIGYAIARRLAEDGASVALLDRLDAVTESAARLAEETGVATTAEPVDITDEASVTDALSRVAERLGAPDALVNSAGITSGTPALDVPLEEFQRVLNVNVTGTFVMCRAFARAVSAARAAAQADGGDAPEATIVNVSSMSAFAVNTPQTQAAYNTSKAAVSMLTSSLAVEWLPLGIRVNAVAPGYVASDMTRDFVVAHPELEREWLSRVPAGRMAEPAEVAELVAFLSSGRSRYLVGQSVVLDGGYTIV